MLGKTYAKLGPIVKEIMYHINLDRKLSIQGRKIKPLYSIFLVYLPNWSRNTSLKIIIFKNSKILFLKRTFKNNLYVSKSRVAFKF